MLDLDVKKCRIELKKWMWGMRGGREFVVRKKWHLKRADTLVASAKISN